jgi:hypothetical protein
MISWKSSIHCYVFISGTSVGASSPWLQEFVGPPVFVAIFGLGYDKGMNYGVA